MSDLSVLRRYPLTIPRFLHTYIIRDWFTFLQLPTHIMSKLVVVLGATGAQGGSVIKALLEDQAPNWKIRAISRDPAKPAAKSLESLGVEVVQADINDKNSLVTAFEGANVIFGVTDFVGIFFREVSRKDVTPAFPGQTANERAYDTELANGKNLVDAVAGIADTTLERFIWSELSYTKRISNGKYTWVYHFDSKAEITNYIKSKTNVAAKTSYLQVPLYLNNWQWMKALLPTRASDGVLEVRLNAPGDTIFPFIDANKDTGKYAKALLGLPAGQTLLAASEEITWSDYVAVWSKVIGETIRYKQISLEEFAADVPAGFGRELGEMFAYIGEFGYDGRQHGILRPKDVGLDGGVIKVEEYLRSVDWSTVIV